MQFDEFVSKCLAIAKIGKKFSTDPYALENYEELEQLSSKMLSEVSGEEISNIYCQDVYPTPSCSVRAVIFDDKHRLLMVQEKQDLGYAVPGGWCEVFDSLRETVIKEVKQETGLTIKVNRLLAIFQRERYKDYPTMISEQVHYFLAEIVEGDTRPNHEIVQVGFYELDAIPELSRKNSSRELLTAIKIAEEDLEVFYD